MQNSINYYRIAPCLLIEGSKIVRKNGSVFKHISRPFALITEKKLQIKFSAEISPLAAASKKTIYFNKECCFEEIDRIAFLLGVGYKTLVAFGGGKLLDTSKVVAQKINAKLITIPTSAATCAAFTSIAPIYHRDGLKRETIDIKNTPDVCIIDYAVLIRQPHRLLASGVSDALAKYFETRAFLDLHARTAKHPSAISAFALGEIIKKTIFETCDSAFHSLSKGKPDEVFKKLIYSCIVLPGVISGIGGKNCRSLGAHALANAMTTIKELRKILHGERVGWGIIVQLFLEGKETEAIGVAEFFKKLRLPLSLSEMGIKSDAKYLERLMKFALSPSENLRLLGAAANSKELRSAIQMTEKVSRDLKALS